MVFLTPLWVCAFVVLGNFLPRPFSGYAPMSDGFLRVEWVKSAVMGLNGKSCVDFFGDSRVAFSLNANELDCAGRNYAFPGTTVQHFAYTMDLIDRTKRADVAVIGLSMNALLFDWVLGHADFEDAWQFSEKLGRWTSAPISDRVIAHLPSQRQEIESMANNYYFKQSVHPSTPQTLQMLAEHAHALGAEVVFLIPPQLPEFAEWETKLAPGERENFLKYIKRTDVSWLHFIDCLEPSSCGLTNEDFADPVHLNAAGASKFTKSIESRLSRLQLIAARRPAR
jgi:lysophospholipase L1-like esterase